MRLKCFHQAPGSKWQLKAEVDADGTCPLAEELAALFNDPQTEAVGAGFIAIFDQIPDAGPHQLGTGLYHLVDKANEIYEFKKGSYRLLCFQHEGAVIICSHLLRKKSQQAPARDVKQAARLRKNFLAFVAEDRRQKHPRSN